MNIDFNKLLATVRLPGSAGVAFAALLDLVTPFLAPADQDELKRTYENEKRDSDDAHQSLQSELGDDGA